MVPVQIHTFGHVFFHDGLEIFRGSSLVIERFTIILHSLFEDVVQVWISRVNHLDCGAFGGRKLPLSK